MSSLYPAVIDFFLVGRSLKSHGTSGQLRILIEDRIKEYVQPGSFIFFDLDGSKVPYQIAEVGEGQHFVISLSDISSKQDSDRLSGKEIWVPTEQVKPRHLKSPRNIKARWEDYRVHDEKTESTFVIQRTEEYPQQLMAVIEIDGKEILIPLHEQLITSIDRENKIIHMNFPEGLLEL